MVINGGPSWSGLPSLIFIFIAKTVLLLSYTTLQKQLFVKQNWRLSDTHFLLILDVS